MWTIGKYDYDCRPCLKLKWLWIEFKPRQLNTSYLDYYYTQETNQLQNAAISNESSSTNALQNTTDNKNEENHALNVTTIDAERDNNSIVNGADSTTVETVTEGEKFIKNDSIIRTDIDYKKIQSDTKDIEVESSNNILQLRRIVTTSTTTQATPRSTQANVFSNAGGNGGSLDDVQTLTADAVIRRRHRRRRQGR